MESKYNTLAVREFMRRTPDVRWLSSHIYRQLSESWNRIAPSEFARLYRQISPLTMCSDARLQSLYESVRLVVSRSVPGDIVECGVARGGSTALMALTLKRLQVADRRVWAFDTFAGLPEPSKNDPDYQFAKEHTGSCVGTFDEVSRSFQQLGILDQCRLVKGLFQNTLPSAAIGKISVLHIDGDWYDSVRICLEELYDHLSPGGIVQIDDYGFWEGARRAVDEFFSERKIESPLEYIDYAGRRFTKRA